LQAILKFILEVHPEMRQLEFYITGESYAGIYVPTLAFKLTEHNKRVMENKRINIKGILVGNGVSDLRGFFTAFYDLAYTHFLYPESLHDRYVKFCKQGMEGQERCKTITSEIDKFLEGINIYDIYRKCVTPPKQNKNFFFDFIRNQDELVYHEVKNRSYTPWLNKIGGGLTTLKGDPPCSDTYGPNVYFNKKEVKEALYIKDMERKWEFCSDIVNQNYQWNFEHGSVELYPKLIKEEVRIWIYSGDTDGAVPVNDTIRWIENLKLPVEKEWASWRVNNSELAGFRTQYKGLTFITVKGTGHMVPQWKPVEALKLFNTFLKGTDLAQ